MPLILKWQVLCIFCYNNNERKFSVHLAIVMFPCTLGPLKLTVKYDLPLGFPSFLNRFLNRIEMPQLPYDNQSVNICINDFYRQSRRY